MYNVVLYRMNEPNRERRSESDAPRTHSVTGVTALSTEVTAQVTYATYSSRLSLTSLDASVFRLRSRLFTSVSSQVQSSITSIRHVYLCTAV